MTQPFELTQICQTEVGDALRIAAIYTEAEFDDLYLRDDLEQQYTPAEIEVLRREIIIFALGKEKLADVTHAGKFRRILYETDDALALQFPLDEYTGVFVSVDSSKKDSLFDIGDMVQRWIERRGLSAEETSN